MANDDIIRAGAVILKDLSLFNQAVIFLEEQIDPAIRSAISEMANEWIKQKNWKGEADVSETVTDMWLCPSDWAENEEEPLGRFRFGYQNEKATNSYEIADLFNLGQTNFGFRFMPGYGWFGGKGPWAAFMKTISDQTEKISQAGWVHEGKGIFFRSVSLAADCRVSAWENEDWSEALAPLAEAFNKLEADQSLFGSILNKAKLKDR